jgi:hypothetical protein
MRVAMNRSAPIRGLVASSLLFLSVGCGVEEEPPPDDEMDDSADLIGGLPEPCELLGPALEIGDEFLKMGFVVGVEGRFAFGPHTDLGGYDAIFDLYHRQARVVWRRGAVAGIPLLNAGASAEAYAGMAFGFERGVTDWNGRFKKVAGSISIPYMPQFIKLAPEAYVTGEDADGDGAIGFTELVPPPEGMFGFNIAVSASFGIQWGASPSVAAGSFGQHGEGTREIYDRMRSVKIAGLRSPVLRLVDGADGSACPEDWPATEPDRNCVIQFGAVDADPVMSALDMAHGICALTGNCAFPLSLQMGTQGVALGMLQKSGAKPSDICQ